MSSGTKLSFGISDNPSTASSHKFCVVVGWTLQKLAVGTPGCAEMIRRVAWTLEMSMSQNYACVIVDMSQICLYHSSLSV